MTKIIEIPIGIFERPKITEHGKTPGEYSPVFIVGAPRTGSTILYQVLTNRFDVLYMDNLIDLFFRNLYFGFWLSKKMFHGKPHNSFGSDFGNTLLDGLRAPSECGGFWLQWLPKYRDFVEGHELSEEDIQRMACRIHAVINRHKKTFIIKNLNNGQRMQVLSKVFPSAKVIFIKRDPVQAAQSILLARKSLKIHAKDWWSVKPKNHAELMSLGETERTIKQIYYIEKQISKDALLFPKENFLTVHYEDLCARSHQTLEKIHRFMGEGTKHRDPGSMPDLNLNQDQKMTDKDLNKIKEIVNQLDWENYANK
ncbi:MAG: sulfotransferase [Candidatus Omnitrophica bacterium]|nr:sulfotransferase [Candidatus Omnitrophota bacterium]